MDHTNRWARWRHIRAGSRPQADRGSSSNPQFRPPREPLLKIQATFGLPCGHIAFWVGGMIALSGRHASPLQQAGMEDPR
ncbi:MAG TPA: hypothetical protein VF070_41285 [Streptosporangiaceae bacterium]